MKSLFSAPGHVSMQGRRNKKIAHVKEDSPVHRGLRDELHAIYICEQVQGSNQGQGQWVLVRGTTNPMQRYGLRCIVCRRAVNLDRLLTRLDRAG